MTTYETSLKLKAAGFPQPHPGPYQIWYQISSAPFIQNVVVEQEGAFGERLICFPAGRCELRHFQDGVFAPTAADILKELGPGYIFFSMDGLYYCNRVGVDAMSWSHADPDECAALAYLEKPIK